MLYNTFRSYEVALGFVDYLNAEKALAKKAEKLSACERDYGKTDERTIAAKVAVDEFKNKKADVLARREAFEALPALEQSICTLGTGELPSILQNDSIFKGDMDSLIAKLVNGTVNGKDIRDIVSAMAKAWNIKTKITAYRGEDETLVEALLGMRYTGFKLGTIEPIKEQARNAKGWTKVIAQYLYATMLTSLK